MQEAVISRTYQILHQSALRMTEHLPALGKICKPLNILQAASALWGICSAAKPSLATMPVVVGRQHTSNNFPS